jgi:hypothetical protein
MFDFALRPRRCMGSALCACGRCLFVCASVLCDGQIVVSLADQAVPENYLCPISADVMADPVICSDGKYPATRRAR